ncbi:MAG: L-threonylcarbamoyladenylate synthase [Gemmatimonadota bacterium]
MSEIAIVPADRRGIDRAVAALAEGRLVLHPTETVVSLSGDPASPVAVERARRIKGYETPRPFLCLVTDVEAARELARCWSRAAELLTGRFWPGPLTIVVPVAAGVLPDVAEGGRLALRAVADPVSRRLVKAWGRAVFSTSANRRGEDPAVRVGEAVRRLADVRGAEAVDLALEADPAQAAGEAPPTDLPSTIVDVSGDVPRLVRTGALSVERLREAVPDFP